MYINSINEELEIYYELSCWSFSTPKVYSSCIFDLVMHIFHYSHCSAFVLYNDYTAAAPPCPCSSIYIFENHYYHCTHGVYLIVSIQVYLKINNFHLTVV